MANNSNNISFDDLIKAVFNRTGNLNEIRFTAVGGTGTAYASCGKNEPYEVVLKKLIGVNGNGCPAIRYIPVVTAGTCDGAVLCGQRVRSLEELVNGSIELGADGLPAVRMEI